MESQSSEDSADELQRLHAALENEQKKRREIETVARQVDVLRRERAVQETAVEMLGEDIENLTSENARLAEANKELERRLVQLQGGQSEASSGTGRQVDGNDRHGDVEELEQQRDAARADVARLHGEVNELRGVIETHVNRLQSDGALDTDDEVRALRSELEMVRKKAEEDLQQLRGQLAAADNPGKRQSDRDVDTVATLQALRQEIDSTQRALSDKEQTLRKSQSQCRSLEDAIEDRDKEIDQLRRKLESLLRKTSGMVESSEFLVSSLHEIPERLKDESEQITLARSEQQTRGMPEMESDHQRTSLGRLFRKR
jgi:chromosome segregation ATPase